MKTHAPERFPEMIVKDCSSFSSQESWQPPYPFDQHLLPLKLISNASVQYRSLHSVLDAGACKQKWCSRFDVGATTGNSASLTCENSFYLLVARTTCKRKSQASSVWRIFVKVNLMVNHSHGSGNGGQANKLVRQWTETGKPHLPWWQGVDESPACRK